MEIDHMTYHVQSLKPAPTQLWNHQTNHRVDLFPGVNKVSDELYEEFKHKIEADPQLSATKVDNISESPVKVEEAPAPTPEPINEVEATETPSEDEESKPKKGKR